MGTPATFGADSASGAVPQFRADVGRCLASTVGRRQSGLPRGPEPKAMNHAVGPTMRRDWVRLGSERQGEQPQATGCNNPTGWGRSWFPHQSGPTPPDGVRLITIGAVPTHDAPVGQGWAPRRHTIVRTSTWGGWYTNIGRNTLGGTQGEVHNGWHTYIREGAQGMGGTPWAAHRGRHTSGGSTRGGTRVQSL